MTDVRNTIGLLLCVVAVCVHGVLVPQPIERYPKEPVWSGYLADPFAFEHEGIYYMIGTGLGVSQREDTFPALMSDDLITWNHTGDVLQVNNRPDQPSSYWAPEIAYHDNQFYLFYSVGFGEQKHRLRVAAAASPLGPFNDSQAIELTDVNRLPFAIDPHPFRDRNDGQWYLFYSRDFLDLNDGYRVGTGIVVDRLIDNLTRLAGDETLVLRARHDWQLYQANRTIYNRTYDWHTLEGAATWQAEPDVFVCFYSGGNWQETSYGVDYGVAASSPMGPYSEDSTNQARITHSIQGTIIGPGHNSIILGPDRQTTYIVYHAWNSAKTTRSPYVSQVNWKTQLPTNSSSGQDLLHVTLVFLGYVICVLLIFHHAL